MTTLSLPSCFNLRNQPWSPSSLFLKPCLLPNLSFCSHQRNKKNKNQISYSISAQSSSFDLSPPPIDHDFLDTVKTAGAEVSGEGIVETFHNDEEALDAADNGVVVVDLSHFGRIRVSGDDRVQFLHNQSTANFEGLQAGQD